jgi:hypothetical protein
VDLDAKEVGRQVLGTISRSTVLSQEHFTMTQNGASLTLFLPVIIIQLANSDPVVNPNRLQNAVKHALPNLEGIIRRIKYTLRKFTQFQENSKS